MIRGQLGVIRVVISGHQRAVPTLRHLSGGSTRPSGSHAERAANGSIIRCSSVVLSVDPDAAPKRAPSTAPSLPAFPPAGSKSESRSRDHADVSIGCACVPPRSASTSEHKSERVSSRNLEAQRNACAVHHPRGPDEGGNQTDEGGNQPDEGCNQVAHPRGPDEGGNQPDEGGNQPDEGCNQVAHPRGPPSGGR